MMFSGAENISEQRKPYIWKKGRPSTIQVILEITNLLVYGQWKDRLLSGIPSFLTAEW